MTQIVRAALQIVNEPIGGLSDSPSQPDWQKAEDQADAVRTNAGDFLVWGLLFALLGLAYAVGYAVGI